MWLRVRGAGLSGIVFLVAASALSPAAAHAGVPRSCIYPNSDALACPRDTRLVTLDVLPSARVRALKQQRAQRERVAPLQDGERNHLLEGIRDELRYPRRR